MYETEVNSGMCPKKLQVIFLKNDILMSKNSMKLVNLGINPSTKNLKTIFITSMEF